MISAYRRYSGRRSRYTPRIVWFGPSTTPRFFGSPMRRISIFRSVSRYTIVAMELKYIIPCWQKIALPPVATTLGVSSSEKSAFSSAERKYSIPFSCWIFARGIPSASAISTSVSTKGIPSSCARIRPIVVFPQPGIPMRMIILSNNVSPPFTRLTRLIYLILLVYQFISEKADRKRK